MKRFIMAMTVALLLMTAFSMPVAASTEIHVYPGQSIQSAVNTAIEGDIIIVHPGTYNEQVVINKGLTLQGFGATTIIKPTQAVANANAFAVFTRNGGGKTAAIVVANANGAPVTVQNLKIDGELITVNGPAGSPLRSATSLVGILYRDTPGTIDGIAIEDIGIKNASAFLLTAVDSSGLEIEVKNSKASTYLKNGITATGPVVVNIHDNTVVGGGKINYVAQNGIQVSYGATGTVHRNSVNGVSYTGLGWTATGILVFESDNVSVQGNTVTDCQTGIGIETWYWVVASASNNKVVNNTINGAAWGVTVAAVGFPPYSQGNAIADNNKVVNNTITSTGGDTGVYIGAYSYSASLVPQANNNKAISNKIKGFTTGVAEEGTRTKVHANVMDEDE